MRGRARPLILPITLLAILLVPLAGCIDEPAAPGPDAAPDDAVVVTDPETGEENVVVPYDLRFETDLDAPYHHEETEDGTFALGEHWDRNGEFQDNAGMDSGSLHLRDISDKVPKGVPVRITLDLTSDMTEGDLDLWLDIPFQEVWAADFDTPRGGTSSASYTIVHTSDDPIRLAVFYDEPEPAEEVRYEVTYVIDADPSLLLPGIPVVVPLPAGTSSLALASATGATGPVWLWDAEDVFLGTTETGAVVNHTFDGGAARGDHVVLIPEGSEAARLRVYAPLDPDAPAPGDGARRMLFFGLTTQDIQQTDAVPIKAHEDLEATFELDRVPVQVGVQLNIEELTHGVTTTLTGPDGALLDVSFQGTTPFITPGPSSAMGFTFLTDVGAEGIGLGTYTATFASDAHDEGELWMWLVHYAR